MVKVTIVGAGGYGGIGMIELILRHPQAELVNLVDIANVGRRICEVHPHLAGLCDLVVRSPEEVRVGDWLLIHTGFAIRRLDPEDAQETLRLFEELFSAAEAEDDV